MKCFFMIVFSLTLLSCQQNRKVDIIDLVNHWQRKEIIFPENLFFTSFATDTVNLTISDSEFKIIVYVDSIGCTSCKLQLTKWKEFINELDTLPTHVPILFFLQSNKIKEIRHILKREGFDYPVCIDTDDQFNTLNHIAKEEAFQTFLLDKENKIILIGNPIRNLAVKKLYVDQIAGLSTFD